MLLTFRIPRPLLSSQVCISSVGALKTSSGNSKSFSSRSLYLYLCVLLRFRATFHLSCKILTASYPMISEINISHESSNQYWGDYWNRRWRSGHRMRYLRIAYSPDLTEQTQAQDGTDRYWNRRNTQPSSIESYAHLGRGRCAHAG